MESQRGGAPGGGEVTCRHVFDRIHCGSTFADRCGKILLSLKLGARPFWH